MPAHVADDHRVDLWQFGREVVEVDPVVISALAEDRGTLGVYDRGWDSGEGESGDEDTGVAGQAERFQREEEGRRT